MTGNGVSPDGGSVSSAAEATSQAIPIAYHHNIQIPGPERMHGIRAAAIWWADHGCTVLPLKTGDNRPHSVLGKFGSRATVGSADPDAAWAMWTAYPYANIGIVNGPRSGLLIIDCDRKPGQPDGLAAFENWCAQNGVSFEGVGIEDTPGGGRHYLWSMDRDAAPLPVINGRWLPGVDLPWQVAVSPSLRPPKSGAGDWLFYRWVQGDPAHLPPAPAVLLDAIRASGTHSANVWNGERLDVDALTVQGLEPLRRNTDMHRLCCKFWRMYWPDEQRVLAAARAVWEATPQGDAPFPWSEVLGRVESARRFIGQQIDAEQALTSDFRRAAEAIFLGSNQ